MAHFSVTAKGQGKVPVSRRIGSKKSGITSHTMGWDTGILVEGYYDEVSGRDCFAVYETEGSNNPTKVRCLGIVRK